MWPDLVVEPDAPKAQQPAPTPSPQPKPVAVEAVRGDDIHDPFSGISIDIVPLAKVVMNKDPFAQVLRESEPKDEAIVDDDVYGRERGEEIE